MKPIEIIFYVLVVLVNTGILCIPWNGDTWLKIIFKVPIVLITAFAAYKLIDFLMQ